MGCTTSLPLRGRNQEQSSAASHPPTSAENHVVSTQNKDLHILLNDRPGNSKTSIHFVSILLLTNTFGRIVE